MEAGVVLMDMMNLMFYYVAKIECALTFLDVEVLKFVFTLGMFMMDSGIVFMEMMNNFVRFRMLLVHLSMSVWVWQ